jgi:hypothetical protein
VQRIRNEKIHRNLQTNSLEGKLTKSRMDIFQEGTQKHTQGFEHESKRKMPKRDQDQDNNTWLGKISHRNRNVRSN